MWHETLAGVKIRGMAIVCIFVATDFRDGERLVFVDGYKILQLSKWLDKSKTLHLASKD